MFVGLATFVVDVAVAVVVVVFAAVVVVALAASQAVVCVVFAGPVDTNPSLTSKPISLAIAVYLAQVVAANGGAVLSKQTCGMRCCWMHHHWTRIGFVLGTLCCFEAQPFLNGPQDRRQGGNSNSSNGCRRRRFLSWAMDGRR